MFVKGHLTFSIEGKFLEFMHENISPFGVNGLAWTPLSPKTHFGRTGTAKVQLLIPDPFTFECEAVIMRDQSLQAEKMGLRFLMSEEQKQHVKALIDKFGFYPTEYVRKYPRIPATPSIQTFPLRVLVQQQVEAGAPQPEALVFDVQNLSPNGMMLSSENQLATNINPGAKLRMTLEARGWFPVQVHVEGLVCRTTDEITPASGNMTRFLGIKFVKVDEANKAAFMDLLRDILEKVRQKQEG